ncbi:hypothetical protein Tco_0771494 [Tanacetum coccineum]|uniref:Uncharacterized protein n=1 Tax=Tanacetum coccineum TaxID=301880 RepID=A0ABQ4ZF71_9ASTR
MEGRVGGVTWLYLFMMLGKHVRSKGTITEESVNQTVVARELPSLVMASRVDYRDLGHLDDNKNPPRTSEGCGDLLDFHLKEVIKDVRAQMGLSDTQMILVKMENPNITMKEYMRLEKEKTRRRGKVYNWETAKYGKIRYDEDVYDLGSVETEFPAIVFNETLTSEAALSCEPTVSSLNNDEIDFRISFDESDDEDCTIFYTVYPNPMDTVYRLSGRYPVFIFSTVYTAYSLNEYTVYRYQYSVSWGMDTAYRLPVQF